MAEIKVQTLELPRGDDTYVYTGLKRDDLDEVDINHFVERDIVNDFKDVARTDVLAVRKDLTPLDPSMFIFKEGLAALSQEIDNLELVKKSEVVELDFNKYITYEDIDNFNTKTENFLRLEDLSEWDFVEKSVYQPILNRIIALEQKIASGQFVSPKLVEIWIHPLTHYSGTAFNLKNLRFYDIDGVQIPTSNFIKTNDTSGTFSLDNINCQIECKDRVYGSSHAIGNLFTNTQYGCIGYSDTEYSGIHIKANDLRVVHKIISNTHTNAGYNMKDYEVIGIYNNGTQRTLFTGVAPNAGNTDFTMEW